MNIEHVEKSYQELESDSTLQNLIAQANARYILYNTEESKENFPRYTIKDEQLNILAFKYLNIGCNYFSEHNYLKASHSLEKGALILEYIHGSIHIQTKNKKLFCLISALSYYVCFQYSKAFILIGLSLIHILPAHRSRLFNIPAVIPNSFAICVVVYVLWDCRTLS